MFQPSPGGPGPTEAGRRLRRWQWATAAAFAAVYFWSYFHRVAPAVVARDLMAAFRTTGAELGTLSAVYPYVFAAMGIPAGTLAEAVGPRRVIATGAATMGLGAVVFGLAPRFGVAVAGRLLVGLGASVMLVAFLRLCAEWFRPEQFATLAGLTQTVGNVGALVAARPLALLVERLGWRASFVLVGALTVLLAGVWWTVARDRPEERGLPPVNPGAPAAARAGRPVLSAVPRVLGNPRSWPPSLAAAGVYGTMLAFLGLWAIPYLTQVYGLTRLEATAYTSAVAVGVIVGSPLAGLASDRWLRRRRPFVAAALLYAADWAALAAPPAGSLSRGALLGVCFLLGLASGCVVLVFACVREVNDPGDTGVAIGFPNGVAFLGIGLAQWGLGALLDARWQGALAGVVRVYPAEAYREAFLACLAVALLALAAACAITETRGKGLPPVPRT